MKKLSLLTKLCLFLVVAVVSLGSWVLWVVGIVPVYATSHGHAANIHSHTHTHGDGYEHGHSHIGLVSSVTHSHVHRHDSHRHASTDQFDGFTEVGHQHHKDGGLQLYFMKAIAERDSITLQFFELDQQEQKMLEFIPNADQCSVQLLNGGNVEATFDVKKTGDVYSARLPEGCFVLPTHSIRVRQLVFGGEEIDAVVPISVESASQ